MRDPDPPPLRVGVLAYPGCFASEVFGVIDLLTMAGHVAAAGGAPSPGYRTSVCSPRRDVTASGGTVLGVQAMRPVDVLVVPGFEYTSATAIDDTLTGLRAEVAAIRAQHRSGVALVSVCLGAFLLAEAGVLDGRAATTSWLFAELFASRYPRVSVHADELVRTDRGVTTTAAFSAMYDFALGLIRERDGAVLARRTARVALLNDVRSTQAPYVDPDLLPVAAQGFSAEVRRQLSRDIARPYDLGELAATFHVSTRTLLRRFGAETGRTPLAYLQSARVRRAKVLLETTSRTVAQIAAEVGYADAGTFSTVFARHAGQRPREYRAAFHGRAPAEIIRSLVVDPGRGR